jgi:hypothetical protein
MVQALKGKKTYLAALGLLITTLIAAIDQTTDLTTTWEFVRILVIDHGQELFTAAGLAGLRAGVAKVIG